MNKLINELVQSILTLVALMVMISIALRWISDLLEPVAPVVFALAALAMIGLLLFRRRRR